MSGSYNSVNVIASGGVVRNWGRLAMIADLRVLSREPFGRIPNWYGRHESSEYHEGQWRAASGGHDTSVMLSTEHPRVHSGLPPVQFLAQRRQT